MAVQLQGDSWAQGTVYIEHTQLQNNPLRNWTKFNADMNRQIFNYSNNTN